MLSNIYKINKFVFINSDNLKMVYNIQVNIKKKTFFTNIDILKGNLIFCLINIYTLLFLAKK